jgi:hypothetical protein
VIFLLERSDFAIALQSRYKFYKSFWICNLDRLSMVSICSIAMKSGRVNVFKISLHE